MTDAVAESPLLRVTRETPTDWRNDSCDVEERVLRTRVRVARGES